MTVVAVIITAIVGAVAFLPRSSNAVPLPSYLDRCVTGSLIYHSHPNLVININGAGYTIPTNIGSEGGCHRSLHTHDATGTIHVETDQDRDYTLGDFFLIWGNWANDANLAIFNSTQIFTNRVDAAHTLTVTVNGRPDQLFNNIILPRNAGESTPFNIVITYGPADTQVV